MNLRDAVRCCQSAHNMAEAAWKDQREAVQSGNDALGRIRCAILNSGDGDVLFSPSDGDTVRESAKEAERAFNRRKNARNAERAWLVQIGRIVAKMNPDSLPDAPMPVRSVLGHPIPTEK